MSARNPWLLSIVLTLLALGVVSCSGKDSEEPAPAATPEEAISRIAHGLADLRPEVLWHALPASYQRDVEVLLHEAAGKMDEELWNKAFDVLEKLSRVLSEKREFILDHPMIAAQLEDRSQAESNWDAVAGMFEVVVRSDLSDLGKLEELDVGEFLSGTGAKLMQQIAEASKLTPDDAFGTQLANLRKIQVTVVSSSGDEATVRSEVPGLPGKEEDYVRVEGKWIPRSLADEWPAKMAEARQKVAAYSTDELQQNKQAALMQLGMVEGALDSLLAAKTADEFNAGAGAMIGMAMSAMMAQAAKADQPALPQPLDSSTQQDFAAPPDLGGPVTEPAEPSSRPSPFPLSDEEQATLAEKATLAERLSVRVDEADEYLGKRLRVIGHDGLDFTGVLTAATESTLTFEREFSGGTMGFEIDAADIQELRPMR